jgi:tRNA threonylcarbamoyladenosine biosynthesis protein TsaE
MTQAEQSPVGAEGSVDAGARLVVPDADSMRELGRRLARLLRPGDLVLLTGELGAGKTTLAQGIGQGLGVRGQVTSPTFVIAREHPSNVEGPPLVHVDAYRLGGFDELEGLDLEASLEEAVTLVEWGEGLVEPLSADRLEVRLHRPTGAEVVDDGVDAEPRTVEVHGVGDRWTGVSLPADIAGPGY